MNITQSIGPLELKVTTPGDAVRALLSMTNEDRRGRHVHLANAYTVALADEDSAYRSTLSGDAINFPDGKHLAVVSRIRRDQPRLQQVRGPQLFLDTFDQGRQRGTRHYLLGSTDEVLGLLQRRLRTEFPGVEIVGAESPPFRPLTAAELAAQDDRVRASRADIVWVGLGTPKQDIECRRIASELPVVAVAVGAAFDFAAGTLRTAPKWMRAVGLEWLHRLLSEPRRLWRRYLFGNARFIRIALRGFSA